jgi:tRNA(fMet)-specific endonuclease VapC
VTLSYLLDTSACIPVLRNQSGLGKLPDPALTGIPVIVAGELWTGVKKNLKTHPHQAARLQAFLELFRIPEFTLDAAIHYADIRAALEVAGTPIGPLDLLIAAQARSLGATLVTANVGEFKRVKGLKVLAWKSPSPR